MAIEKHPLINVFPNSNRLKHNTKDFQLRFSVFLRSTMLNVIDQIWGTVLVTNLGMANGEKISNS